MREKAAKEEPKQQPINNNNPSSARSKSRSMGKKNEWFGTDKP